MINVFANVILLMYMRTLSYLADVAAQQTLSNTDIHGLSSPSPVLHATAGLLLLLVAVTLSVYKPRGMTPYGRRKQHEQRTMSQT